jgi:hypothetical protein
MKPQSGAASCGKNVEAFFHAPNQEPSFYPSPLRLAVPHRFARRVDDAIAEPLLRPRSRVAGTGRQPAPFHPSSKPENNA